MDQSEQRETNSDKFTPEELQLIGLVIKTPTITKTKLAQVMKLGRGKIIEIYNREHVQNKIKDYQLSNIDKFNELQTEALEGISKLFKSKKEIIRLQAYRPFVEALKTIKLEHSGHIDSNIHSDLLKSANGENGKS